jgi:3-phosphoshikimate 1-carboxyvinyltransferase
MILSTTPPFFRATIDLPASKSLSNRWLVLNACANSNITFRNLSKAADTALMQELLNKISQSVSLPNPVEIDCKNAGTVLRFLTAYLSVTPGKWTVTGDERLSVRPIDDLVVALKNLGAEISYVNQPEQLPLMIIWKPLFSVSRVKLNMQKSSQFASALMLMISKFPKGLQIDFEGEVISKPYLEMTAKILERCGVEVKRFEKKIILKGAPKYPSEVFIESDWTAASYFYGFVALSEEGVLKFKNLHLESLQGDSILAEIFEQFGVRTEIEKGLLVVRKVDKPSIKNFEFDFTDYPDLAQTLAVVCAALKIPAQLNGLSSLRDKETDRLQALSRELNQIGAKNIVEQDSLIIRKYNKKLDFSKPVKTYGDHRMAMAFSIFSGLYNDVEIVHPEVVNKSFPNFWKQVEKLKSNQHEI